METFTIIKEATHGWRIKKLKRLPALRLPEPWQPGSHNCSAAKSGRCFCSGACMRPPGSAIQSITLLQQAGDGMVRPNPLTPFTYTAKPSEN